MPEEVDGFVDGVLKSLGPRSGPLAASDLAVVREVIWATYGKEPKSEPARTFAAAQVWYAPRADFSIAELSATQQAVLKALDRRIDAAKGSR